MSVVDWVNRVKLTCGLHEVKQVIPLRLMGSTLDVYQQLNDNEKADVRLTKSALYKAFVICFTTGTLMTADVFFVVLKKLMLLFGGLPEQTFVYVFVAGLSAWVKELLRVSTSIKAMPIEQLLEPAQAIIRDEAELWSWF